VAEKRRRIVTSGEDAAGMDVLFVTSVSVITPDPAASRRLWIEALGLPLEPMGGGYLASERIGGCRHLGVWPLAEASQACFGRPEWPPEHPVPQASIELELADADAVAAGTAELQAAGFPLLHGAQTEPWGQVVARLLSPEGVVLGLSYASSAH
jgi:catechol 2,3-dioxygenase-like lactoylglutathione lyase family enzyme